MHVLAQANCPQYPLFAHGATMDPTQNATYALLDKLLGEMTKVFPDTPFLHLGGWWVVEAGRLG
jgi:hypothetical protein